MDDTPFPILSADAMPAAVSAASTTGNAPAGAAGGKVLAAETAAGIASADKIGKGVSSIEALIIAGFGAS
jgi:hypothetical protein